MRLPMSMSAHPRLPMSVSAHVLPMFGDASAYAFVGPVRNCARNPCKHLFTEIGGPRHLCTWGATISMSTAMAKESMFEVDAGIEATMILMRPGG